MTAALLPSVGHPAPRLAIAMAAALAMIVVAACVSASDLSLEARAQGLDKQLICPVCPGETIDQSQVQIAKDMRGVVREKLSQGESEEDIKRFFVDRYGPRVLASPPNEGFNILAWAIPALGLVAGIAGLSLVMRAMYRRAAARGGGVSEAPDPSLAPYLDAVDAELRRTGSDAARRENTEKQHPQRD